MADDTQPADPGGPVFGRLMDLSPRDAWGHEAHAFTPWLAENIDRLAEAVGMELELTGQEVRVERYAADILARDPTDGSAVLIENQLEATDHTHLGQILTYLAGLDARAVIGISPEFREPHLSAIRWLNEHTAEGFAFFAVRLRVVRIGASPMAPLFEVVEKPNGWERRLTEARDGGVSQLGVRRGRFWDNVVSRDATGSFMPTRQSWSVVRPAPDVRLVSWIGRRCCGSFVRTSSSAEPTVVTAFEAVGPQLESALDIPFRGTDCYLQSEGPGSIDDPATWDDAADWLIETRRRHAEAIQRIAGEPVMAASAGMAT